MQHDDRCAMASVYVMQTRPIDLDKPPGGRVGGLCTSGKLTVHQRRGCKDSTDNRHAGQDRVPPGPALLRLACSRKGVKAGRW
jgi:hypothetical protein